MAKRILMLGAGPTTVGAALRLLEKGNRDFLILEASDHVGGLASSFVDDKGFTWDVGGHVQFSHYHAFDRAMEMALGVDGWLFHERQSFVWMEGRFIPYPFQNNIRHLTPKTRESCLAGLEECARASSTASQPRNFKEWIFASFGKGIAETFLFPYNFKVWATPLEKMDFGWIGERVAVVDIDRVKENIRLGKDDVSWGPNNQFRFPLRGGTGAIWKALGERIPPHLIRLNTPVASVDLTRREVKTVSGEVFAYDSLLTTVPLDQFCTMTGVKPLIRLGKQLVYSATNVVGVGLKGTCPDHLKGKCWMYFPEANAPFYRTTVFSNYSPNNVPDPARYWSLMTETSESVYKQVNSSSIVDESIQGCLNSNLIADRRDVVSACHYRVSHGYPVPFLGRDEVLKEIHAELEPQGVYSRGRFGGWKYEVANQDHSFMQGMEWVDHLLEGTEETTYHHPAKVNHGKKV